MSEPSVPYAAMRAAIDPNGPANVSVSLAKASDHAPQPELHARADLLKCAGAKLSCCAICSRFLAPAAEANQRWIEPADGPTCIYFADVEKFHTLYDEMTEQLKAVMEENRLLRESAAV
jgi:hypothetical protein